MAATITKPALAPKSVDWDALEPHFRAGVRTLADMGEQFGVTPAGILKHAKKFGWTRNLKAKIADKAAAKMATAIARETNPQVKMTEALRVEVEAEVISRVQIAHRVDIGSARTIAHGLLAELEAQAVMPDALRKLIDAVSLDTDSQDLRLRRLQLLERALSLGSRVSVLKSLAEAMSTVVKLERQAFGMDDKMLPPAQRGPLDGLTTDELEAFDAAVTAIRKAREPA